MQIELHEHATTKEGRALAALALCDHRGTVAPLVGQDVQWCRACGALWVPVRRGTWFRPEGLLRAVGDLPQGERLSPKARACLRWLGGSLPPPSFDEAKETFGIDTIVELVTADVADVGGSPARLTPKPPPMQGGAL
jgi:hypothetical protein